MWGEGVRIVEPTPLIPAKAGIQNAQWLMLGTPIASRL
jgi:hypothetical protein